MDLTNITSRIFFVHRLDFVELVGLFAVLRGTAVIILRSHLCLFAVMMDIKGDLGGTKVFK